MSIRDILRHRHGLGLPRAEIAAAVGVSTGMVFYILERALEAGLSWPLPDDIGDEALRARLYPPLARDSEHVQPDWEDVIEALQSKPSRRRVRMTRRQLWVEYRDEARVQGGRAYGYSRFCARLKARLKGRGNAVPAIPDTAAHPLYTARACLFRAPAVGHRVDLDERRKPGPGQLPCRAAAALTGTPDDPSVPEVAPWPVSPALEGARPATSDMASPTALN